MEARSCMMLRVLINRYNPKAGNALMNFLPEDELAAISKIDIRSDDLQPILQHPQSSLGRIHHTWIKPLLEKFPDRLQPALLAALTPEQAAGMKGTVEMTLSKPAKSFLLNQLFINLKINEHIPLEYLPEHELLPLIKWSKQQLVDLIDFLGLYDLASEVRQIVNSDHLKSIYSCLSPKQFQYLKICMHQKEQIVSSKLGIDPGKPDCTKLKKAMHRHGLSRLGKAFCGLHEDFVWTIAHTLDMGRGSILLKEYQPVALPKITQILKQQVLNVMNFVEGRQQKTSKSE